MMVIGGVLAVKVAALPVTYEHCPGTFLYTIGRRSWSSWCCGQLMRQITATQSIDRACGLHAERRRHLYGVGCTCCGRLIAYAASQSL